MQIFRIESILCFVAAIAAICIIVSLFSNHH